MVFSFYIVYDTQLIVGGKHRKYQFSTDDYVIASVSFYLISPVLDSKVRKLKSAFKSFSWNRDEMKKRGWML